MFGLSKKSHKPTTFYALAFCIQVVAFILMAIGMFTPYWSEITEQVGTTTTDYVYDKGLIISCPVNKECLCNTNFTQQSDTFFTAFVLGILAIIFGFFCLQLFTAGLFVRSVRETNLGVPISCLSIGEGALLCLELVFFEISIGRDTTSGNIHRDDTFGFSRGLIIGAIILYWISALFIIGEYVRRHDGFDTPVEDIKPRAPKRDRRRPPPERRGPPAQSYRQQAAPDRGRPMPPPYNSRR